MSKSSDVAVAVRDRRRKRAKDAEVWIIRSGYRTDEEWRAAILTAQHYGRRIVAIDMDGRKRRITRKAEARRTL